MARGLRKAWLDPNRSHLPHDFNENVSCAGQIVLAAVSVGFLGWLLGNGINLMGFLIALLLAGIASAIVVGAVSYAVGQGQRAATDDSSVAVTGLWWIGLALLFVWLISKAFAHAGWFTVGM